MFTHVSDQDQNIRRLLEMFFIYTDFHLGEGNIRLLAALHLAGVHVVEGHDVVTHVVAERILVVVFGLKKIINAVNIWSTQLILLVYS
jgi:hypothetical protein